ncbi:MAG: transposase [Lachnospiraceae bacterium]|jgi:transposase|nr:transposase [Lachnospiraceae bacterium]
MKLWFDRKSKDPTYFIQQGFRNGKKTSTRNVKRIGKHSELLAITDDPLAYAKEQVAKYNEEMKNTKVSMDLSIDFDKKVRASDDVVSASALRNIGYYYLQHIYHDLQIGCFFKDVSNDRKIEFDPNLVNRFLTCARILSPASKLRTHVHLTDYYEQPDFDYVHILRTMDLMEENYEEYIRHLYKNSSNVVKRNTSVCYYDCSNFYFEIESPDLDYVDEVTGEVISGFRKYGMSKEHRPNPIVEMGLFMDSDGIPLSMCLVPGNQSEQTTAVPLEKELSHMLKGKSFIYCADAGLGSYHIRNFNSMGGRAFIVTQSIKKLSDILQQAVFSDCDYRLLSSGDPVSLQEMKEFDRKDDANRALYLDKIFKVIPADNLIDLGLYDEKKFKNGKTKQVKVKGLLPQKLIITFSRKMMEYQRYIRNRQIERAKNLLKNIDPETYKKGPNDVTRFIKRNSKGKNGEKAVDQYVLDLELIAEEEKYDGFYAVATNLDIAETPAAMKTDVGQILDISAQRYKIEDCFRLMKTNFSSRPVYHRNKPRIIAHFMICYTALLIFRLLQKKLDLAGYHFTPNDIVETLQNMQVTDINDLFYTATYEGSQILTALNTIYPLSQLDRKYYQPKDLNKKFKKISR